MQNVVAISTLQNMFLTYLDSVTNSGSILYPVNSSQINAIKQAVQDNKDITPGQLAAAASFLFAQVKNSVINFRPMVPPAANLKPIDLIGFQFGQGINGWYYLQGNLGNVGVHFNVMRYELASPNIVNQYQLPASQACLYWVSVGYGIRGGSWTELPSTVCQMNYTQEGNNVTMIAVPDASVRFYEA